MFKQSYGRFVTRARSRKKRISPKGESRKLPWDRLFYIGTIVLKMSEEKFWRTTSRKLLMLWDVHCKFNGLGEQEEEIQEVFIDQILPL